jgi:hypothetical protein
MASRVRHAQHRRRGHGHRGPDLLDGMVTMAFGALVLSPAILFIWALLTGAGD